MRTYCAEHYEMKMNNINRSRAEKTSRMKPFTLHLSKRGLKLLRNAIKLEILRLMRSCPADPDEEEANFEEARVLNHIREDISDLLRESDTNT